MYVEYVSSAVMQIIRFYDIAPLSVMINYLISIKHLMLLE
jgi:hypothetical protein